MAGGTEGAGAKDGEGGGEPDLPVQPKPRGPGKGWAKGTKKGKPKPGSRAAQVVAELEAAKEGFLSALETSRNVRSSARSVGQSRTWAYAQRVADQAFASRWDEATRITPADVEDLVGSAWDRAVNGWQEPVFYKGKLVGSVRKFHAGLTVFMLKAWAGDRYKFEHLDSGSTEDERAAKVVAALRSIERVMGGDGGGEIVVDDPVHTDDHKGNGHASNGNGHANGHAFNGRQLLEHGEADAGADASGS